MVIRWWRATAGSDDVLQQYAEHLTRTTFVEMAELPGHLGPHRQSSKPEDRPTVRILEE